jgi:plastocyanin
MLNWKLEMNLHNPMGVSALKLIRKALLAVVIVSAVWLTPEVDGQQPMPGFGIPQLVRLDPKGIIPIDVTIKPGSTIIWLNSTRGFVTVVFAEGEETATATQSPTRFFLAPDGTYTSNAFGPGAVASLAFLSPGKYRYFVSGVPGDFASGEGVFGKVVVRVGVKKVKKARPRGSP